MSSEMSSAPRFYKKHCCYLYIIRTETRDGANGGAWWGERPPKNWFRPPVRPPKKIGPPPQPNFVQRPVQEKRVCKRLSFEEVKKITYPGETSLDLKIKWPAQEKRVRKRLSCEKCISKITCPGESPLIFLLKITCPGEEGPQRPNCEKFISEKSPVQEKHP